MWVGVSVCVSVFLCLPLFVCTCVCVFEHTQSADTSLCSFVSVCLCMGLHARCNHRSNQTRNAKIFPNEVTLVTKAHKSAVHADQGLDDIMTGVVLEHKVFSLV